MFLDHFFAVRFRAIGALIKMIKNGTEIESVNQLSNFEFLFVYRFTADYLITIENYDSEFVELLLRFFFRHPCSQQSTYIAFTVVLAGQDESYSSITSE